MKKAGILVVSMVVLMAAIPGALALMVVSALGGTMTASTASYPYAASSIPPPMLALYIRAAQTCDGLSWSILAAIGTVESDNGKSDLPGVHSGHNFAGAEGPMQFEPPTFDRYSLPVPPGGVAPPTPYDPTDAVFAAARMLCADGAADPSRLPSAIFAYNHSQAYVSEVLRIAGSLNPAASGPAGIAVSFALSQVGTPYRWGGETAGVGFDCSGLVQAAWAAAGVHLPRVAADQLAAGPRLVTWAPLSPGDLVFFGPSGGRPTHVGMVVDPAGRMIDAPHTGAFVRVEPFPTSFGGGWGSDVYLGATRPA